MSAKTKTTKIASSNLPIGAVDKNKVKIYVEHGFVELNGKEVYPNNENDAWRSLNLNCSRNTYKQYKSHVERELQKAKQ